MTGTGDRRNKVSVTDIRLRNLGTDLAAAETIRVEVRLPPLLHRQVENTELILEKKEGFWGMMQNPSCAPYHLTDKN